MSNPAKTNEKMELTYTEALGELERILASLRSEQCDVDTLAERTRRAAELLQHCRSKLTRTEAELAKVLEAINSEE